MKFTVEERIILDNIAGNFSRRAKHAYLQSFDEFMNDWYEYIESVENGYKLEINSYTNDLTKRDLIDELLSKVPLTTKDKIKKMIEPWDNRFSIATNVLNKPIFREDNPAWWWYRIPKKLVGELKEDVRRNGIK